MDECNGQTAQGVGDPVQRSTSVKRVAVAIRSAPVAAKTRSVPAHERLRPNDVKDLEDGWKPAIQLDEEQAVAVGQPNSAPAPTP